MAVNERRRTAAESGDGTFPGWKGYGRDGEGKETKRAFATLLENLPGVAYRCSNTPGWPVEWVSRGSEQLIGLPPEDLVGPDAPPFETFIHEDDRERVWAEVQEAIERQSPFQLSYRLRRADGEERWIWEQGCAVHDAAGHVVALEGLLLDVTQTRRLQEQLRHVQRLDLLGKAAGCIAHDFQNLLAVIESFATLVRMEVADDSVAVDDLQEIMTAAQKARRLTERLLEFGGGRPSSPKALDLDTVIRASEEMLRRMCGPAVKLDLELAGDLQPIHVDATELDQVLVNLVLNARDATEARGEVVVRSESVQLEAPLTDDRATLVPGRYARVSVSDDGVGMSAATLARAFDPFFTTKPRGRGTGLGLATCAAIVRQAGGHITVESEEGRGTTVTAWFPAMCVEGA